MKLSKVDTEELGRGVTSIRLRFDDESGLIADAKFLRFNIGGTMASVACELKSAAMVLVKEEYKI